MGGQACVFYGAAQVSKDVDLVLLDEEENFSRLLAALEQLNRENAAAPRPGWIEFWLQQARSPEFLAELAQRFPADARALSSRRPLL